MLIQQCKRWSQLLNSLNRPTPLFTQSITNSHQERLLSASATVAHVIADRAPEVLEKQTIHICIAGAQSSDMINGGEIYHCLPRMLHPEKHYHIHLVGDQLFEESMQSPVSFALPEPLVSVHHHQAWLGMFLKKGDVPVDVVILLNPGFEAHITSWVDNDDGLAICLKNNIPVLGASYGTDEAEIDAIYLRTRGYQLDAIKDNPFYFFPKEVDKKTLPHPHCMDWSRQTWRLSPQIKAVDESATELRALIDLWKESNHRFADETGDVMFGLYGRVHTIEEAGQVLLVWPDFVYLLEHQELVRISDGVIVAEDIELDVSLLGPLDLKSPVEVGLRCAVLIRDYLSEWLLDEDEEDDGDALFPTELVDQLLPELKAAGLLNDDHETSEKEDQMIDCYQDGGVDELRLRLEDGDFTREELAGFRDPQSQSWYHVACLVDDVALVTFAHELGVDPYAQDRDVYSCVDTGAVEGSVDALSCFLSLNPQFDLNKKGRGGFTPLLVAASRGQKAVMDLLRQHGAQGDIPNDAGITADQVGEMEAGS